MFQKKILNDSRANPSPQLNRFCFEIFKKYMPILLEIFKIKYIGIFQNFKNFSFPTDVTTNTKEIFKYFDN
jgi:hypothetical protein